MAIDRRLTAGLIGGASLLFLCKVTAAQAQTVQEQAAPDDRQALATASGSADIVVTANKREQRLLEVPSSVSAVTGEELARTQALDLQDIAQRVPGLAIQSNGAAFNRIIIRGQNASGDGATAATVVDDVPLSFSSSNSDGGLLATDFETYDLERIEVLRGPQGTLYGATAEGGLFRYVTRLPEFNRFSASVEGGGLIASHGTAGGSAKTAVNIPIGNDIALRASGYYTNTPGFIDNATGKTSDYNGVTRYGGRVSILARPLPGLTIRGTAFLQWRDRDGADTINVYGLADPARPYQPIAGYNFNAYTPNTSRNRLELYAGTIGYDAPWARLESITSYGVVNERFVNEIFSFEGFVSGATATPSQVVEHDTHALTKFNQEFRIASRDPIRLLDGIDWQVGAFYTDEHITFSQFYSGLALASGATLGAPFGTIAQDNVPSRYRDIAGYADATIRVAPVFDVELGGRISRNRQTSQSTINGLLFGLSAPLSLMRIYTAETVKTYSIAPRFHITPDVIAYARVASGYRPGGPQLPVPGQPAGVPTTFGADSTTNYEIGLKGQAFDHHVTFDVAGFYIDWKNIQLSQIVTVFNPVTNANQQFSITGNGGSAVSTGAEFSLTANPAKGLSIGAVGAYTDAYLTADAPGLGAKNQQKLLYVPDWTSNLNFNYETPFSQRVTGFVGGAWAYTGRRVADFSPGNRLPGYSEFSLQLGVRTDRYTVELYGKNLSDARGITTYSSFGSFGNTGSIAIVRPRTTGVRVTANF